MNVEEQIQEYIISQSEPKMRDMQELRRIIVGDKANRQIMVSGW